MCIWILILCLNVCYAASAQKPEFSGTWKLNIDKSNFNGLPVYAAVKQFDIEQKTDSITIKRTLLNANNEQSITVETVALNGKPSSYTMNNKRKKTSTITWSQDQQVMNIVSTRSFPDKPAEIDIESNINQSWRLSPDRKELKVILTTNSYTIEAVYDKY